MSASPKLVPELKSVFPWAEIAGLKTKRILADDLK